MAARGTVVGAHEPPAGAAVTPDGGGARPHLDGPTPRSSEAPPQDLSPSTSTSTRKPASTRPAAMSHARRRMSYANAALRGTWSTLLWSLLVPRRPAPTPILGSSPALKRALEDAALVAPTTAAVLIRGESGTGKELFAKHIHERSGRTGELVVVNCAALPEAILESVLFGHKRGAFTGASDSAPGLVVGAHGGTLFLDEVGELPPTVQAKLLRVLQQRTVLPVGEVRERPVDVRVVAASHRDLRQLVVEGRFREDLYHRLARFELTLPPLRERGRDVLLLARAMLASGIDGAPARQLSRGAEPVLLAHSWPGNVRELANVLFRSALAARDGSISAELLCAALGASAPAEAPLAERVLDRVRGAGSVTAADLADQLAVPRTTLGRLLRALVDAGDLATSGQGKATRYQVAVREPEACADPRQRAALELVAREGRLTRAGFADAAGLPLRTAGRVLAALVEAGLLAPDGRKGNGGGYVAAQAA